MQEIEDRVLIKTFLLTRSELVFRQLYRKHSLPAFRLALQLVNKDIPAAEDVVQEAWIRAVERLHEFRWQSSFRTWLSGIVINCSREHSRSKIIALEQPTEFHPTQQTDREIDLQSALALLPKGFREILLLHDMEGYKHNEIAMILDISEGTSKSQLFHARRAIKKLLN